MKRLLKGGRVVDPANGRDGRFDILIDGDRIARIGTDLAAGDDTQVIAPGVAPANQACVMTGADSLLPSGDLKLNRLAGFVVLETVG